MSGRAGRYARWEPTGTTPSVPRGDPATAGSPDPTGTPVMTPTVPREPARIGLLDADGEWLANPALRVQPGERLSVRVHVRNQSGITDTFQVAARRAAGGLVERRLRPRCT